MEIMAEAISDQFVFQILLKSSLLGFDKSLDFNFPKTRLWLCLESLLSVPSSFPGKSVLFAVNKKQFFGKRLMHQLRSTIFFSKMLGLSPEVLTGHTLCTFQGKLRS